MAEIVKLKDGTKELYPVTVGQAVMLEHGTLQNELDTKQDILISGTNIKTINNEPIIGEGNITIDAPDNVALISDDLSVDSTTHIQASEIEYGSTNVANALNTMRTTTRTYLLSPTGWNDGIYTIESEFVTLESTQDILPTVDILPDQLEALQAANIIDGGQTNGKLYLKALGDIPLISLPIRIVFRGELVGSALQDASTVGGNVVPFSFGVDADGNYGYIKAGADSVTPFSKPLEYLVRDGEMTLYYNFFTTMPSRTDLFDSYTSFKNTHLYMWANSSTSISLTSEEIDVTSWKMLSITANAQNTGGSTTYLTVGLVPLTDEASASKTAYVRYIDINNGVNGYNTFGSFSLDVSDIKGKYRFKLLCEHSAYASYALQVWIKEIRIVR